MGGKNCVWEKTLRFSFVGGLANEKAFIDSRSMNAFKKTTLWLVF